MGGSAAGYRPPSLLPYQAGLFPCAGQPDAGVRQLGQHVTGGEPGLAGIVPGAPQPVNQLAGLRLRSFPVPAQ